MWLSGSRAGNTGRGGVDLLNGPARAADVLRQAPVMNRFLRLVAADAVLLETTP